MTDTIELDMEKAGGFAERVSGAGLGAMDICSIYLGDRLGLYPTLEARGPLTALELADACNVNSRYAREWLEQGGDGDLRCRRCLGGARRTLVLVAGRTCRCAHRSRQPVQPRTRRAGDHLRDRGRAANARGLPDRRRGAVVVVRLRCDRVTRRLQPSVASYRVDAGVSARRPRSAREVAGGRTSS